MRRFLFLLSLCSAFVGCQRGNTPELPAEADFDGDGVRNADDCAPWNDAVAGDFDGDGWLDRRCLEMWEAGNPNVFLRGPVERHHDCDDRDPARHPWLGPDGQPDFYEHAPDPDSFAYEACDGAEMPPAWAWDGIDNDCDPEGKVDVADWDHDSFTSTALGGGDCNDCRPTVHPDIDEHAVVQLGESVCPVYMYDDIDNDCDPTTRDDDFDEDGVEAGWDAGSACGAVINATTGLPLSELATGDDCDDIEVTIYGGAPEFCDLVDQDCDGDPLNGFLAGDLGPVVYVNAANAGVDAFVATGQSPELGLPDLASAMASVATCPEVVLEPGDYTERVRLDLVVFREEDAVPEGVDPDAHGNADTHPAPPAAGAPESVEGVDRTDVGALVGHTVRIRGAGPGVSLRGDGTRALEVWLLASQTLELQDLELVDASVESLTREERLEICMTQNTELVGQDKVISATSGVSSNTHQSAMASSNGFSGTHARTSVWLGSEVTLKGEGDRKPEGWMWGGAVHRAELPDPKAIAATALERVQLRLGSVKGPSKRTKMVVDPAAAGRILGHLLRPANGRSLSQGQSFWAEHLGKKAVSDKLTLIDDPLLRRGFSSRPYDGDGIAAKPMSLIEGGVLQNVYIDTYYGQKLGMAPTATGGSNQLVTPGERPLASILADIDDAIYVTSWLGGNSDPTTGDFSLGLRGHLVEKGQVGGPIDEMNITGNLVDLFANLVEVGSDPWPYSSRRVPTLVFDAVDFS